MIYGSKFKLLWCVCGGGWGGDCKKALGALCPSCKNMGLSRKAGLLGDSVLHS